MLGKVKYLLGEVRPLYLLAKSIGEVVSITLYLLMHIVFYYLPPRFRPKDVIIHLCNGKYAVGLGTGEAAVFQEIYSDKVYDRMKDFVPCGGWTVVDVGANVGLFAVLQAKRGARVYAFEPHPDCYRRLCKNLVKNRLTGKVDSFNYGISSGTGTALLVVPTAITLRAATPLTVLGTLASTAGDERSLSPTNAHMSSLEVRVASLDCLIPCLGIERIDLLKIDAEGAEVDVLKGAAKMLAIVERVIIEYHADQLRDQVVEDLSRHGFMQVEQVSSKYNSEAGLIYAKRTVFT